MQVLIVESDPDLGESWQRQVCGAGCEADLVDGADAALAWLDDRAADVILVNMILWDGSAMAVAEYAQFRWPQARVIFVTETRLLSRGTVFDRAANACAVLRADASPNDLAAVVRLYGAGAGGHSRH